MYQVTMVYDDGSTRTAQFSNAIDEYKDRRAYKRALSCFNLALEDSNCVFALFLDPDGDILNKKISE